MSTLKQFHCGNINYLSCGICNKELIVSAPKLSQYSGKVSCKHDDVTFQQFFTYRWCRLNNENETPIYVTPKGVPKLRMKDYIITFFPSSIEIEAKEGEPIFFEYDCLNSEQEFSSFDKAWLNTILIFQ